MLDTASVRTTTPDTSRRDNLVITLLLVSAFVVILNETIMGVAVPRLVDELGIDYAAGQWLTTAFMLTMAVVIPLTGFLMKTFSTRALFILAMTLFSVGTLMGALSPGFSMLVVARVVQATGTAIMMPLLMTTVMTLVAPAHRGRMMGRISIVIAVAPALGPTVSGLIIDALPWQWLFVLVLPIALAALVLGAVKMVNVSEVSPTSIDIISVVLSALGFGGLVFGLSSVSVPAGVLPFPWWAPVVAGAVSLLFFTLRQLRLQKRDAALIDLRTLTNRNFAVSLVIFAIAMMAMFGALMILPIYLQNVLGLSVKEAGMLMLPGGLIMGLLGPIVGRLFDRIGARPLIVPGAAIVAAVFFALSFANEHTAVWLVLIAHMTMSLGLAFMFTPLFSVSLGSLDPSLYGHGSALLNTIQQLAGAAGAALFISIMSVQIASSSATGATEVVATASGIRLVMLGAAILAVAPVFIALLIKHVPVDESAPAAMH